MVWLAHVTGTQEATQQQETSKATQQLLESSRRLLRLRHDGQQGVTAVRVAGDEHENARRQREEHVRQELRGKLLAEAESSAAANAAVAVRWGAVLGLDVPQELFQAIEEQRMACEAVIASKDRLIADIRCVLKGKDEEYVKLLKRQAADVDVLLGAMARQLADLAAAYREELENVERALLQERAELLASNRKEVAALLEARSAAEANFTEKYLGAVESYAANLEELRHADAEEYQVLKIKLESDIAVLEQHLETMRATYQLNAEKLEYNYRVLLERDAENTATINQQKRKLSRQHDVLSSLKHKYAASDAKASEENSKLTDEYKRITEQFKDLQVRVAVAAKFRHFGNVDAAKYSQLWRLQQQEACGLVRQLLAADRVIHEQQLGWQWAAPGEGIFVSPYDVAHSEPAMAGSAATAAGVATLTISATGAVEGVEEGEQEQQRHQQQQQQQQQHQQHFIEGGRVSQDGAARARSRSSSGGSLGGAAGPHNAAAEVAQRMSDPSYYGALCLLADEAGFLIDAKAAALIAQLPPSEGQAVAAKAVVRSLGVSDGPAFDALMDALSADGGAGAADRAALSLSGAAPPLPLLVHPDEALQRLKQFVEAESGIAHHPGGAAAAAAAAGSNRLPAATLNATGPSAAAASSRVRPSLGGALAAGLMGAGAFKGQVVSMRAAEKEKKYWERLTKAVSDKEMRVWGRLEGQLASYHGLLLRRSDGLAAIGSLQQQNDELRMLLNQYLSSKINAELKVPPTAVL
ncbi:sperm tail-domain-containing protein [Scenedesmus sp. NREL 46B-D3]|nr:sperm tail-domain-containing protein [Scenedesmus sp. NREL 46B-D3]